MFVVSLVTNSSFLFYSSLAIPLPTVFYNMSKTPTIIMISSIINVHDIWVIP